jgi:hypothetical protein
VLKVQPERDGKATGSFKYYMYTLGCPAAHNLGFKQKGLSTMLRDRKKVSLFLWTCSCQRHGELTASLLCRAQELDKLPLVLEDATDQLNALADRFEEAAVSCPYAGTARPHTGALLDRRRTMFARAVFGRCRPRTWRACGPVAMILRASFPSW